MTEGVISVVVFLENVKIYFGVCSVSSSTLAKYQINIRPMQRF